MKSVTKAVFAAAALVSLSNQASAAIVLGEVTGGTSGGVFETVSPSPGYTLGDNNQESPNLFALDELQGVTLAADLFGIAAGTIIDSHHVWFDPSGLSRVIGTVTFDGPILAIVTSTSDLNASDFLGRPDVTYTLPSQRGIESSDIATFSGRGILTPARTVLVCPRQCLTPARPV